MFAPSLVGRAPGAEAEWTRGYGRVGDANEAVTDSGTMSVSSDPSKIHARAACICPACVATYVRQSKLPSILENLRYVHPPLRSKHRLLSSLLASRVQRSPWQVSRIRPAQRFRMRERERTSPCSVDQGHGSCLPAPFAPSSGQRGAGADLGDCRTTPMTGRAKKRQSVLTHHHTVPPISLVYQQRTRVPLPRHRQHSKTGRPSARHQ